MKFPSDEEVLQEFRNRPDAVPSSEFLHTLEGKLVAFEASQRKQRKVWRATVRLSLSVAVLVGVFLLAPSVTKLIMNPASLFPNQSEAPLVVEGQKVRVEDLSPAAKQTLDKLLELVPELKKMKTEAYGEKGGIYAISFKQMEQEKELLFATVEVVAASGKMKSFDKMKVTNEEAGMPTEQQAKQVSAAFLQELLGAEFARYQASQTGSEDWQAVTYTRYENGFPVFSDRYVVGVSGNEVSYVNTFEGVPLRLPAESFSKPDSIMSEAEVLAKVASLMELGYFAVDRATGKPSLRYSLESTGYLHAETGKEVWGEASNKSKYSDPIPVTPGGRKITVLTMQEVAKAMSEEFQVNMNGFALAGKEQTSTEMMGEQQTIFEEQGKKGRILVYTNNQKIRGFQIRHGFEKAGAGQRSTQPENAWLSYAEARDRAIQFLQPYLDRGVTALKIDESEISMPYESAYSFNFFALHDGVVVHDQNYLVNVDSQTGEIVNFMDYYTSQAAPFPDVNTAIAKEAAAQAFLQSHPAVLGYVLPVENGKMTEKPLLVYSLDVQSFFMLDAVSGK